MKVFDILFQACNGAVNTFLCEQKCAFDIVLFTKIEDWLAPFFKLWNIHKMVQSGDKELIHFLVLKSAKKCYFNALLERFGDKNGGRTNPINY